MQTQTHSNERTVLPVSPAGPGSPCPPFIPYKLQEWLNNMQMLQEKEKYKAGNEPPVQGLPFDLWDLEGHVHPEE